MLEWVGEGFWYRFLKFVVFWQTLQQKRKKFFVVGKLWVKKDFSLGQMAFFEPRKSRWLPAKPPEEARKLRVWKQKQPYWWDGMRHHVHKTATDSENVMRNSIWLWAEPIVKHGCKEYCFLVILFLKQNLFDILQFFCPHKKIINDCWFVEKTN